MENYINIYGLLFAKTADGKLAFTGQIYDEQLQKFQSDINKATPQLDKEGKLPIDLLPEPLQNATSVEIVAMLPETGKANKIYLVKNEGSDPVAYDALMWIDNSWASFGGSGAQSIKYVRQNLSTAQKMQARINIDAISGNEFYNFLYDVINPMYIGQGDDDFSQYDMSEGGPMYNFLSHLIGFMGTIDKSSPVFWVYSDSKTSPVIYKVYQIVAWREDYIFSVMSITGDLSEYEISVNNDRLPTGLTLRRTINIFKSVASNTVKGVEVVQGTAPMQQDNILYIELEETT